MVVLGDNLEKLKALDENSIDAVVTDPPYGLKFMGKRWDADVPSVDFWKEVIRVLKPGGHLLSFGGTRTYHRMVVNIEDAGFEIRDQLQWIFGSGFPKSHNIGDGRGTALKPANEPIVLARKPLSESTVAKNVLKWGTGALNIDASRISLQIGETTHGSGKSQSNNPNTAFGDMGEKRVGVPNIKSTQGRWPANLLLDEEAAQMLDEQSGVLKSGGGILTKAGVKDNPAGWQEVRNEGPIYTANSGGASRFFYVAKSSKAERNKGLGEIKLNAEIEGAILNRDQSENPNTKGRKANPIDCITQNKKLHKDGNFHPTVKPIKLMEYLLKLITPPKGTILDPFMGSGSTGVAAKNLGFEFIGIEIDKEYFEIAQKRIGP